MSTFEVIRGPEGCCLALDDVRIAGPKPWGGGRVIHSWDTDEKYAEASTCECVGTIKWEWGVPPTHYEHELSCGHVITSTEAEPPNYCEVCGAKVRKEERR